LERYLSRAVALQFSGQGKGKSKKGNFSATTFYRILEGKLLFFPFPPYLLFFFDFCKKKHYKFNDNITISLDSP